MNSRAGEAGTLNYIGKAYNDLGNRGESLKYLNQSMAIWHELDNTQSAAPAQNNPGNSSAAHPYYWAPFVLIGNYQ